MKKNYTCPVVEVNAFDFEDVVMVSNVSYEVKASTPDAYAASLAKLKAAAAAESKIVVEW